MTNEHNDEELAGRINKLPEDMQNKLDALVGGSVEDNPSTISAEPSNSDGDALQSVVNMLINLPHQYGKNGIFRLYIRHLVAEARSNQKTARWIAPATGLIHDMLVEEVGYDDPYVTVYYSRFYEDGVYDITDAPVTIRFPDEYD